MQEERVEHEGIIKEVFTDTVDVLINCHTACDGCHSKNICGMGGSQEKIISAIRPEFSIEKGEPVIVYTSMHKAMSSVFLAFVIPVIIIAATIATLTTIRPEYSELAIALIALFSVSIYFFILYLNKERLGKKITFTIEKIKQN